MVAADLLHNARLIRKINILCLLAGIAIIIILPFRKEIWYDETVSVLCSKGISHDAPLLYGNTNVASSASINQLNTVPHVFDATVNDNGNSFLYNIGLHWFIQLSGNRIAAYMWFSKLLAIATLIAFYFLCNLFFKDSVFTSLALLLLATDADFTGMSHEIRAYAMGILFVTLAAIYFYKFMYRAERPVYLLLTGLFSVAAILSHFLSVYIILVFLAALGFTKKAALLSAKNLLALALPVILIAVYICFTYTGLQTMSKQNHVILEHSLASGFSLVEVLMRGMKFTAINLKAVFPSYLGNRLVNTGSFLLVMALYWGGIKATSTAEQKRNLHLLFWLGAGSSLFLTLLCVKSHHYTALYYRYFSFCLPFCSLYVAYLLHVFFSNNQINKLFTWGIAILLIVPSLVLFVLSNKNTQPRVNYNHISVAGEIVDGNISKIAVPEWRDAFLINSVLPADYKIDYFRNPAATSFTLYKGTGEAQIPVIRIDK